MNIYSNFYPLKNRMGFGAIGIAVAINVVVFGAALINLSISQINQQKAKKDSKNVQLEQLNKNAFTVFNKLLNIGLVTKNSSGRWDAPLPSPTPTNTSIGSSATPSSSSTKRPAGTEAQPIQTNLLWNSLPSTGTTNQLGQFKINFCNPEVQPGGNASDLSKCPQLNSQVTVAQELPDQRLKLVLIAENGKHRSSLNVLTPPIACVESTDNTLYTTIQGGGYFGPVGTTIVEKINVNIRANNLPFPEFNEQFDGVQVPSMILRSRGGVEDIATLTQTCNLLGYQTYVSSVCAGPDGCNYRSPDNNKMLQYNASTKSWSPVPAAPKTTTTFLYGITCRGKKLCYGGPTTTTTVDCRSPGAVIDNSISPSYTGSAGKDLWNRYLEIKSSGILPATKIPSWCLWGTAGCSIGNVLHNDNTSHLIACQMLGYSAINTRTSNYFRSTGDNGTLNWVTSAKRFEMWPGAVSNTYVGQFTCKGKLQQVCYDKPDWIFK